MDLVATEMVEFRKANKLTDSDEKKLDAILNSPTYRLAVEDVEFLKGPELRPLRMELELLKCEMLMDKADIESTIVVFGGTQVVEKHEADERLSAAEKKLAASPEDVGCQRAVLRAKRNVAKAKFYDDAREFSRIVSAESQSSEHIEYVVATGGGPGIMEAANRGADEIGAKSIGLNITLPHEQAPNPYITPELCFQFQYFAIRKMHFLLRAKGLVVFPGGFGTLDELFCTLTLRQTQRMQEIPIILFGTEYWKNVINFQFLADEGVISDAHLDLLDFVDTPQHAWDTIKRFHNL